MPRRPRVNLSGLPLHIVQRGNNRTASFFAEEDYRFYLHWLRLLAAKHHCSVHAYVLMSNHVHLLLTPAHPAGGSGLMQAMGGRYVQYVNRFYKRSGTLWERRFKASVVHAEEYLLKCYRYIELNPVRAGMVAHPRDYSWSSYRHHAEGVRDDVVRDHALYLALDADVARRREAYAALFRTELDEETLGEIRSATRRGHILGNDRFREEIESALGRRRAQGRAGRSRRGASGLDGEQMEFGF
jgi:putative transposase